MARNTYSNFPKQKPRKKLELCQRRCVMAGFNVNLKNCEKEPQLRDCFYKLTIGMFVGCFLISNYCRRDRSRESQCVALGHGFFSSSQESCLQLLPWFPLVTGCTCEPNKPFPPPCWCLSVFHHSTGKPRIRSHLYL